MKDRLHTMEQSLCSSDSVASPPAAIADYRSELAAITGIADDATYLELHDESLL